MEALNCLLTRRSTKKYDAQPISKEDIEKIVQAGQNAPSGMNLQPTAFVVIENKELRDELSRLNGEVFKKVHPNFNGDPFYGAPVVIAVLASPEISRNYLYDGSLAMGNMLNAAHALHIGACWIHRAKEVFASAEGQKLLKEWNLSGYEGIGFCILGKPEAEERTVEKKSKVVWA